MIIIHELFIDNKKKNSHHDDADNHHHHHHGRRGRKNGTYVYTTDLSTVGRTLVLHYLHYYFCVVRVLPSHLYVLFRPGIPGEIRRFGLWSSGLETGRTLYFLFVRINDFDNLQPKR